MHCASLLRTIFASFARANERVHAHNEISFLRAKLDSERNVLFLLNDHGDLSCLLHNSVHIVLFDLKKNTKFLSGGKKILVNWEHVQNR